MNKMLLIIPTKNRPTAVACLLQNLLFHDDPYDIFVGDMSDDPNTLLDTWYFVKGLEHHRLYKNRNYVVQRVEGTNQHYACQAGLDYASANNYEYCFISDDDLIYDKDYFKMALEYMDSNPDCGVLVGMTYIPYLVMTDQIMPPEYTGHPDFAGTIDNPVYYHCTMQQPGDEPRNYEQLYGGHLYRTQDAINAGGYPKNLSTLGNRGEMILECKIAMFTGKRLTCNPKMISWHYSQATGGCRTFDAELRKKNLAHDMNMWDDFVEEYHRTKRLK